MMAKGVKVDDRLELAKELGTMFRNQNGNMFANEMMQEASRSRLHKDEALYNKTGDLDELYKADLGEFHVGAEALGEALKTLASATTAPMMHGTAIALSGLAGALQQVSAAGFRHPTMAATAGVGTAAAALAATGWLGSKLMNGFGLAGSATALTGSAAALDAAAARLGAAGGIPHGEGLPGTAGKVATGAGVAGAVDGAPAALAIPSALELGAGGAAFAGGIFLAETVRKTFEAQQPGQGGLYAPVTAESEGRDRQDVEALKAERAERQARVDHEKAMEKVPGWSDPSTLADRDRIAQLDAAIAGKERSFNDLDAARSHEARVGRAMMAMPRPEEAGPEIPPELRSRYAYVDREGERGRAYGGLRRPEEFGPEMPPLHVEDGYPGVDRRTFGSYLRQMGPLAAEGVMPSAKPPGGPIPVQIVGGPPTASAVPPAREHDAWLDGDRPGIEERARRGAAMFRQDHEGAAGRALMDHDVSPHADTSALDQIGAKAEEAQGHLAALGAMVVSPSGNTAGIDAIIAKAREATAALQAMARAAQAGAGAGAGVGGSGGGLGTSYPQTNPAGRNGGGR